MNRPSKVLEAQGLLGNTTNLSVSIVFIGLWFLWAHVGMCFLVYVFPNKNECCKAITCMKWWPNYDSLLQHAALQNQTPWNWLPAHLDLICDSTFLVLPCHSLPAPLPEWMQILSTKATTMLGDKNTHWVLFFCRDVRKFNNSFLRHIWDKESVRTRDRKSIGRQGWEMNFQIMSNHLAPGVPFLLSLPTLSLSLPHSILYSFSKRLPCFRLTQTIRLKVTGGRHKDILLRETVMLGCH